MSRTWPVRSAGVVSTLWGGVLLARGRPLWWLVTGREPDAVELLATRALGLRHLGQGVLQAAAPTRLRGLFVAVDLVHVATMVPIALGGGRRRRAAALTAAVALASAATTVTTGRARGA